MRRQRILITLAALLIGVIVLQEPASADCAGPTLTHDGGEFDRNATLTVTGQFFGDNCYDTGPPPDGEDVLGRPISGIEVLLIQGDNEWIVATGSADETYEFEVQITIPAELATGTVTVAARWPNSGGELFSIDDPIVVLESDPLDIPNTAATFGPAEADNVADDENRGTWIAFGIVIAALAIGGLVVFSKR